MYCGKGRGDQSCHHHVIDAHDRDILRDPLPLTVEKLNDLKGIEIHCGENGGRACFSGKRMVQAVADGVHVSDIYLYPIGKNCQVSFLHGPLEAIQCAGVEVVGGIIA